MITATHNCAVLVLVENGREKAKFVKKRDRRFGLCQCYKTKKKHFEIPSTDDDINAPANKRLKIQKE